MSRKPQTMNDQATTSKSDAVADAKKQVPAPAAAENVEKVKKHKPSPMSPAHKDVLEGLEGNYRYSGPTLTFECRAGKTHMLIKGRDYIISDLPHHEAIANVILRRLLVKSDAKKEA